VNRNHGVPPLPAVHSDVADFVDEEPSNNTIFRLIFFDVKFLILRHSSDLDCVANRRGEV
jgi:hypothetical protein